MGVESEPTITGQVISGHFPCRLQPAQIIAGNTVGLKPWTAHRREMFSPEFRCAEMPGWLLEKLARQRYKRTIGDLVELSATIWAEVDDSVKKKAEKRLAEILSPDGEDKSAVGFVHELKNLDGVIVREDPVYAATVARGFQMAFFGSLEDVDIDTIAA
jgi:hypothetical protein